MTSRFEKNFLEMTKNDGLLNNVSIGYSLSSVAVGNGKGEIDDSDNEDEMEVRKPVSFGSYTFGQGYLYNNITNIPLIPRKKKKKKNEK